MNTVANLNASPLHIRPPAPTASPDMSLSIKAAAINIVNWRLSTVGRNKLGPAEIRVAELIERALNEIGGRLEEAVEADMTSADPAASKPAKSVDDAVQAFTKPPEAA